MGFLKRGSNRLLNLFRREDSRWLFWSVYYPFNFGDWIGPYLYQKISNRDAWFAMPNRYSRGTVYMSAGSILSAAKENCVVWGSGIIDRKVSFQEPRNILAVRGPYTRDRCKELGYSCPEIYGDPGILLPRFYGVKSVQKKYELGIVPHYQDFTCVSRAEKFCHSDNVCIIDVRYPIEHIIDQIVSCERIVSSSLHGIIVAHAYGVPAGWVSFGGKLVGDSVKFNDHYASLGYFKAECLEDALNLSVNELIHFADSSPSFSVTALGEDLLSVCPFPAANPG